MSDPIPSAPVPSPPERRRVRLRTQIGVAALLSVLGVGAAAAGIALAKTGDDDSSTATPSASPTSGDTSSEDGDETATTGTSPRGATEDYGVRLGKDSGSPVEVVVTEDFQCPFCRDFERESGDMLDKLVADGTIVLDVRPVSFLDPASRNDYSSRAANAALCVLDQDGAAAFERMHDALFADQPEEGTAGPEDDELIATAGRLGTTGIDDCVTSKAFDGWLDDALAHAQDEGFSGTPWVRVDGRQVPSDPASLRKAIEAAAGTATGTSV